MMPIRKSWLAALAISAMAVGCAGEDATVPANSSSPAANPTTTPAITPAAPSTGTVTPPTTPGEMKADIPPASDSAKGVAGSSNTKDEGPAPAIEAPKIEPLKPNASKKDDGKKDDGKKDEATKVAAVKLSEDEIAAIKKLPAGEQAAALKQAVCPVSGEHLGEMGTPIKVSAEGKSFYLCCADCKKKVDADPKAVVAKLTSNLNAK